MTTVLVDDEPVEVDVPKGISAMVAPGDANIEVPGYYLIGPEQTVATASGLSQADWDSLRGADMFKKWFNTLWRKDPPETLAKSNLAVKHSVGLIMMLWMARCEGLKSHVHLPETYLHPQQTYYLMSMIQEVTGNKINL